MCFQNRIWKKLICFGPKKDSKIIKVIVPAILVYTRLIMMCMLWFKFNFAAKFLELVQYLFSFVM